MCGAKVLTASRVIKNGQGERMLSSGEYIERQDIIQRGVIGRCLVMIVTTINTCTLLLFHQPKCS